MAAKSDLFNQWLLDTGAINNAGTLTAYDAGTVNLKDIWPDAAESSPLANPFTFSSSGRGNIYLETGTYDFVIKDSDGNTLYTLEDIAAPINPTTFSDASFQIYNDADNTKIMDTDMSSITTGNTRTLTMADRDLNLDSPTFTDVYMTENLLRSVEQGITASTTQSQGEQPLTKDYNEISNVAVTNDVITLPSAETGRFVWYANNGSKDLQTFPASGDNFQGIASDTSIITTPNGHMMAFANNNDEWQYLNNMVTSKDPHALQVAFYENVSGSPRITDAQNEFQGNFTFGGSGTSLTYTSNSAATFRVTSYTGVNDHAVIAVNPSGGNNDAYFSAGINGGNSWKWGLDNSDSDSFRLDYGLGFGGLGPDTLLKIDTNGAVAVTTSSQGIYAYGVGELGDANTSYARLYHSGSGAYIDSNQTGSGTARDLHLQVGGVDCMSFDGGQAILISYTVGTLPASAGAGSMIYVTDESGGAVPAFHDGSSWRRFTDRAIVS